jgi:predicted nucleic acid-binding protein
VGHRGRGCGCNYGPLLLRLDPGERAAIVLAASLKVDVILMDDRAGVAAAKAKGFAVVGTLGILDAAARRGKVDLAQALDRLRETTFAGMSFSRPS